MSNPKISVITPSFNQGNYIKDTIESVLAQKYTPFEHIVVDGGSTDNTVEILKQYPHLIWSSEKDGGQSDALNKALAKTTGDIIAWINSDDWYEPGTFSIVAEALNEYPVVMGGCAIVDEKGEVTLDVPNTGRIWFDLLKYWIGYSIPTQPAVFFRKDLLPALERIPGQLFDKDLFYAMDYDLWLRMAIRTPLVRTIDRRFAYYRMTESNKTGATQGGMSLAEPEMARVFRRAETIALAPAYSFSVLLSVKELSDAVRNTIETVLLQSIGDFELLLIVRESSDPAKTGSAFKELQNFVRERNAEQLRVRKDSYCKIVKAQTADVFASLDVGFQSCEGRHVVVIDEGVLLGSTFLADALNTLNNNRIGMLLPWKQSYAVYQTLVPSGAATQYGAADFVIARLFDAPVLPLLFIARRAALLECGELLRKEPQQKILRELIATMLFKGWHVSVQNELRATAPERSEADHEFLETNRRRIAAEVVVALDTRLQKELFAKARAQHGSSVVFDATTVANCRGLIEKINLLQ